MASTIEWTDERTDGRTDSAERFRADIRANKKNTAMLHTETTALQTLPESLALRRALHLGPFAARAFSLALFPSRFLRLKRNKCVFTLNMKDF